MGWFSVSDYLRLDLDLGTGEVFEGSLVCVGFSEHPYWHIRTGTQVAFWKHLQTASLTGVMLLFCSEV